MSDTHKKARRLDHRRAAHVGELTVVSAEDAKDDGADERKRDIGGHDTQPADGHGKAPLVRHLPAYYREIYQGVPP